jgi:Flp pilus assembly protein TadD
MERLKDGKFRDEPLSAQVARYLDDNPDIVVKFEINILVPISLPPGTSEGHCKALVERCEKSLAKLGGGVTTLHSEGGWFDESEEWVKDTHRSLNTYCDLADWLNVADTVADIVEDIQEAGKQRCVWLTIDRVVICAEPLNLIGRKTMRFPSQDEFLGIDPAFDEKRNDPVADKEPLPPITVGDITTNIAQGDDNAGIIGQGNTQNITNIIQGPSEERLNEIEKNFNAQIEELTNKIQSMKPEPKEITDEEKEEVEELIETEEYILSKYGINVEPWTLLELGDAAELAGRTNTAQNYFERALKIFTQIGDRAGEARSLNNLGRIAATRGDPAEAERLHRESLAIAREIGNRRGEAGSLNNLGYIADTRGDLAEAERLYRESLAIMREIGDRGNEALLLNNLGINAAIRGDLAEAEKLWRESVRIKREIGIPIGQWLIDKGY